MMAGHNRQHLLWPVGLLARCGTILAKHAWLPVRMSFTLDQKSCHLPLRMDPVRLTDGDTHKYKCVSNKEVFQ